MKPYYLTHDENDRGVTYTLKRRVGDEEVNDADEVQHTTPRRPEDWHAYLAMLSHLESRGLSSDVVDHNPPKKAKKK